MRAEPRLEGWRHACACVHRRLTAVGLFCGVPHKPAGADKNLETRRGDSFYTLAEVCVSLLKGGNAADEFQEALSGLGLRVNAREALAEEFSPSRVPPFLGLFNMCWLGGPSAWPVHVETCSACTACCQSRVRWIRPAPLSLDNG